MAWYYARGEEQVGPVSDAEFRNLADTGQVNDDTLVWRDGMADWQPYASVKFAEPVTPILTAPRVQAAPDTVACAECGTVLPSIEMIEYRGQYICPNCKGTYFQRLQEGVTSAAVHRYAGFWIRLVAKIVDSLIVTLPLLVITFLTTGAMFGAPTDDPSEFQAQMAAQSIVQLLYFVVGAAYTIYFLGAHGATPGKMVCGIKVIRSDGSSVTYARAAGRFLAEILSSIVCYIGYIMAAFDAEKRALHDHICDTRVVYK